MILRSIALYSIYIFFACSPLFVFAAADTFTVTTLVGNDTTAPTVPTNLTAEPVSIDQIDLDWDASSDNVAVSGYQVYRDDVQIATTSLTSYSDTSLSSSTLYAYYIRAFDAAYNYSASSTEVATSTLAPPPVVVDENDGNVRNPGSYFGKIEVFDVSYEAGRYSIDLSYKTSVYVRSVIRWGQTSDYESGYIATNALSKTHTTRIDGLMPDTTYEIEIVLTDRFYRNELREILIVKTAAGPDLVAPPNVMNLRAEVVPAGVSLSWLNPDVSDFSHVRVLSSDLFYPTHSADGWLVYEGDDMFVVDDRVLDQGVGRYYTVFAYDEAGNYSSGAVVYVLLREDGTVSYVPVSKPLEDSDEKAATSTMQIDLAFDDILFIQNDKNLPIRDLRVILDSYSDTIVSVPYELLPEHLKTVVVYLTDPEDSSKVFSFLLRINSNKTAYEARFAPLLRVGVYPTGLNIFDHKTSQLLTTEGEIETKKLSVREQISATVTGERTLLQNIIAGSVLSLLLLLFILFLFLRRRVED